MTKRRNPRADEVPLQWKTHVGFKQIATKEEKEKLQGIYADAHVALFSRKDAPKARCIIDD